MASKIHDGAIWLRPAQFCADIAIACVVHHRLFYTVGRDWLAHIDDSARAGSGAHAVAQPRKAHGRKRKVYESVDARAPLVPVAVAEHPLLQ